jgi:hypothetical protein
MCHLVLLLPLFGLTVFWLWPPAVAIPVYLIVLVVSAGAYYLTSAAMRLPVTAGREALVDARGKIRERELRGAAGTGPQRGVGCQREREAESRRPG